jgi:putative hydrolase of the HAD superfamily
LRGYFRRVEVVTRKDATTYERILAKHGVATDRFMMVGDSLRSDVLPVLELGGWAVHVPYPTRWVHEEVEAAPVVPRFRRLDRLELLPESLLQLEAAGSDPQN